MKILQISYRVPYPLKDGGSIGIYNFTKGYHDLGHEVTLLAMNTTRHFVNENNLPKSFTSLAKIHLVAVDNVIKIEDAFLNLFTHKSYNIQRFISPAFEDKLVEILEAQKFDVIHFDGLYVSPYLPIVRAYSNAKTVMRAHNVEHVIWQRLAQNAEGFLKKQYLKLLSRRLKKYEEQVINKFDIIIAITEEDKKLMQELGCTTKIVVSPAGIDINNYIPDSSFLEWPSLFHIGALDWMPNQEGLKKFLTEEWGEINTKFPELKFYIAGRNMPAKMNLWNYPNVIFVGEVEDAIKFINSKAIMIVPLFSGGGMRIKIIEGMALGKTIISTFLGAEGIPYTEGKNILITREKGDMLNCISKCVSDKKFCESLGKQARQLGEQYFDNKNVITTLIKYYQNEL